VLDDDEDLDQMSLERLRELKQEVLLRIEDIGSRDAAVEPERARHDRSEFRLGARIAAGEQGHVMALGNQFLGQPRYHAFGAAIKARRNAFHQWRNLCNFHGA